MRFFSTGLRIYPARYAEIVRVFTRIVCAAMMTLAGLTLVHSSEPRELTWVDMRPPADPECRDLIQQRRDPVSCRDMVVDLRAARCGAQTVAYQGARIRIAGYAHPLSFEFKDVKRFYLAPAPEPCAHSLPPLANQVILVETGRGIDISFDPIYVTGSLSVRKRSDDMVASRYYLYADSIEPAQKPDVISR